LDVKGNLIANVITSAPIVIQPYNPSNKWSNIKFTASTSTLNYVNISGGNLTGNGAVMSTNSNLTLNNVNILNSRAPAVVYGPAILSSRSILVLWDTPSNLPPTPLMASMSPAALSLSIIPF